MLGNDELAALVKELREELRDATNILISCNANRQDIARYEDLIKRAEESETAD